MDELWKPWLGSWVVAQAGEGRETLTIQYHDDSGLTGTWGTSALTNVWVMWMSDFDRSVFSAELPSGQGSISVVLCMQRNFWSQIWGAIQYDSGAHGLLTGSRSSTGS